MSELPEWAPQEAKPVPSPEFPMAPSVKTEVPATPFAKLPEELDGNWPVVRMLGVSAVHVGVNALVPLSLVVVIAMACCVPEMTKLSTPAYEAEPLEQLKPSLRPDRCS